MGEMVLVSGLDQKVSDMSRSAGSGHHVVPLNGCRHCGGGAVSASLTNSFWRSPTKAQIRGKSIIAVCEYSKTRSERCGDVSQAPERYLAG